MSYVVNYPQYGNYQSQTIGQPTIPNTYGQTVDPSVYPNYNTQQMYGQPIFNQSPKFAWSTFLYVGIGGALIVIIMYITWIYTSYRYSSMRIAEKLLTKYKAKNKASDPPRFIEDDIKELAIDTATLTADKKIASAQILLRNKETHVTLDNAPFTAINKETCSPLDNSCIKL